jgi:hypothetical protein
MNAYNQENTTSTNSRPYLVGTVNRYDAQGSDNTYGLLVKRYTSDVRDVVIDLLQSEKKMSEKDAETFCDNMFSLGSKRESDIREEIKSCYEDGQTKKNCAKQLIDKYYKITKVNKYQNGTNYQTDRDQSGEGEVTEVSESVRSKMTPRDKEEVIRKFINSSKNDMEEIIYDDCVEFFKGDQDAFFDFIENEVGIKDLWERVTKLHPADYDDVMVVWGLEAMTKEELIKMFKLMQYGSVNEKVKYEEFKLVSPSLFWNFVNRLNELELKFVMDTTYVRGLNNSLNTQGYIVYMETPKINNREVEYEFKYSKVLSNILGYILDKESGNETSFYLGFDVRGQLHFGFLINEKRYKIGYIDATSHDFQKLIPHITADRSIDLSKLSRKFISNIESLGSIRTILNLYLERYDDDIVMYNSVINNNFGIVIESLDDEVVSQQYIEEIIKKYVKISHYSNWYIEKMKSGNKTFYYFVLK